MSLPGGDTLGVWRGTADVTIKEGEVSLTIYDGVAIVGSASKWKSLTGGMAVTLGKKGEMPTRPIPERPAWDDPASQSFAVVRGDDHAVLGLAWKASAAAAKYQVEVGRDSSMIGAVTVIDAEKPVLATDPLGPGAYFARVRAISSDGIPSLPTPVKALHVAHLTIPASAVSARGGVIVLPNTAGVMLDDSHDVEYATVVDGAKPSDYRWAPAPDRFSLSGAPRRALMLRQASTHTGETPVTLVLRELEAQVTLSPLHPKWPKDPVDVTIKLGDKSGYIDASNEPMTADVRIDIDKVDFQWKHAGETWTARIPPRTTGNGPWRIRVYVKDKAGVEIGGGLLDVDGTNAAPSGGGVQQVVYQQ